MAGGRTDGGNGGAPEAHGDRPHGGMGLRGVTRPMAEGRAREQHRQMQEAGGMDRDRLLRDHHRQTLWAYWTVILLGVWTLVAPLTFGWDGAGAELRRDVWLSPEARATAMRVSDLVSGALLVLFGWRSLTPDRPKSLWAACFVGVWLTLAPVIFWAPTAAAYLNDTIVGALVIALTILVPGMPNMIRYMQMGPAQPAGWSYNPSSWPQRGVMIALAFAGWMVSRYLAAYQLGYVDTVWDPFFGGGTQRVLESRMSRSLPVSDAALGALAYTFEGLMGFMGSPARWRTMPWMVAFFGILVIPLGSVHIFLVISQPVVVGAWCTFCLVAAAIMLPMIPLEVDEVGAMIQHLAEVKRRGGSVWKAFWLGGDPGGSTEDSRSPPLLDLPGRPGAVLRASVWGMSVPWSLAASAAIGVGLMFVPWALGVAKPASALFHLGGALTVTFSVFAMGEIVRPLRIVNVVLGLGIAGAGWALVGAGPAARFVALGAGLAIALLALPRGPKRERYGLFDPYVF